MLTSLAELTESQKGDMIASLSIFLAASGTAEEGEDLITPAKLQAIAKASGNSLSESLASLVASVASNAPGGVLEAYMPSPGGGGGGGYVSQKAHGWEVVLCFLRFFSSICLSFLSNLQRRRRRWRCRGRSQGGRTRRGRRGRHWWCGCRYVRWRRRRRRLLNFSTLDLLFHAILCYLGFITINAIFHHSQKGVRFLVDGVREGLHVFPKNRRPKLAFANIR